MWRVDACDVRLLDERLVNDIDDKILRGFNVRGSVLELVDRIGGGERHERRAVGHL